jgi:hypothetical protein
MTTDTHIVPMMVGIRREMQGSERTPARRARHPYRADQLSDDRGRHQAAAYHANAQSRGRGDRALAEALVDVWERPDSPL